MKKNRWISLVIIVSILAAIISTFYFFPSIYEKAIYDYENSEAFIQNEIIYFPEDISDTGYAFPLLNPYMSSSILRITTIVSLILFLWSLIIPYKIAIKSAIYRFFTDKLPYEITWLLTILLFYLYVNYSAKSVYLMFNIPITFDILSQDTWQVASANIIQFLSLSVLFFFISGSAFSIRSLFHNGLLSSFKEHSFILKYSVSMKIKLKIFLHYIIEFKPRDKQDKHLIFILILHFIAIVLCCMFWGNGLLSVTFIILYCILIYVFQHRKNNRFRNDYQTLSQILQRVAGGDFKTSIDEQLGIYEPLKQNLQNIENSFQEAVTQEVRSQNMRTELITNVSHDLKTPLTSMISYIDLLKKPDITSDQQQHYIQILDKSSNRLKHLIEDIFEISKATSGNLQFDFMQVDIVSLIKQVEMEYESLLKAHDLTVRNSFSNEKIILELDPQKTFRILENLFVNAGKYAMEHTRIYIHIEENEDTVSITIKNISAIELNFEPEAIIERFQRADESRNTEGSGLGLAIAKSFTELQKGHMDIVFDADLFTVSLTFPKSQQIHK